jgi:hypothetical protein
MQSGCIWVHPPFDLSSGAMMQHSGHSLHMLWLLLCCWGVGQEATGAAARSVTLWLL